MKFGTWQTLVFTFLTIIVIGISCKPGKNIPDVSNINVVIQIQRFEQDLFALDTANLEQGISDLRSKYGPFFNDVFLRITQDKTDPDTSASHTILKILKSPSLQKLKDTCASAFPDLEQYEKNLEQAFKFQKYYLPDAPVPAVVSYVSEFGLGTFTYGDSLLGVGLDFFLGFDFTGYDPNYFPDYIKRTMTPDYMVPKMIEAQASNLVGPVNGDRLLDYMITNGKMLYLKDLLLPYESDEVKMEYTEKQLEWAEENEFLTWTHFLKEELIYSTRMDEIQKLINPSPVAPGGMPQEAPGRIGNWMGWQIIKSYMKRNPEVTIPQLLAETDNQRILDKAMYKPGR
jgi:hypothetical protein